MFRESPPCLSLCPLPPVLSPGTEKSVAPSSSHPPFRYLHTLIGEIHPCAFFSPGWIVPALSAFRHRRDAPVHHLRGPLLDSNMPREYVCLTLGSPELDPAVQGWPHYCWVEGKDHLPRPAENAPPNAAPDIIHWLWHRPPRSFSAKLLSRWTVPSIWCLGLFLPRCRTLQFCLLNFMKFL